MRKACIELTLISLDSGITGGLEGRYGIRGWRWVGGVLCRHLPLAEDSSYTLRYLVLILCDSSSSLKAQPL